LSFGHRNHAENHPHIEIVGLIFDRDGDLMPYHSSLMLKVLFVVKLQIACAYTYIIAYCGYCFLALSRLVVYAFTGDLAFTDRANFSTK